MAERIWDKFLTERDRKVFAAGGFGAKAGFGKKPALLVIDVNYAFCGERPEPILEAIKKWRPPCGDDAWDAMPYLKRLIDTCHKKGVPVIYTTGTVRADGTWDPSPEVSALVTNLGGLTSLTKSVAFRLHASGTGAAFQVDNVFLDPFKSG